MHRDAIWCILRCYSGSVLRQGILTSCALTSLRLDDFSDIVIFCNENNFGGEAGRFGGGELLPFKYPR